jgi:precorrin-6B methylase 2
VAVTAARFLAPTKKASIIDIGAGVGKFCVVGSIFTKGNFTGIEQRKKFIDYFYKALNDFLTIDNII